MSSLTFIKILKNGSKPIGYFLTFLSFYLLINIFYENNKTIENIRLDTLSYVIFSYSITVVLIGHFSLALTWFIQLRGKYKNISLYRSFIAIGLSQIAKYLPGNVAHLLGRALLIGQTVRKKDVAITLLIETLILSFTAALFGCLWVFDYILPHDISKNSILSSFLLLLCITVFIIEIYKRKTNLPFFTYKTFISIFTVNTASFFLHGSAIYLIAFHVVEIHELSYLQCSYGFALSFLIGYLLPGASGGIGVREYAFVVLFIPFIEQALALQVIIIYRLITIIGDVIIFVATYTLNRQTYIQS